MSKKKREREKEEERDGSTGISVTFFYVSLCLNVKILVWWRVIVVENRGF